MIKFQVDLISQSAAADLVKRSPTAVGRLDFGTRSTPNSDTLPCKDNLTAKTQRYTKM